MTTGGVACSWLPTARGGPDAVSGMSRACRVLFGPVDREANRRFVRREMAKAHEEARRRWNFDFETDTPLDGRYLWTAVDPAPPGDAEEQTPPRCDGIPILRDASILTPAVPPPGVETSLVDYETTPCRQSRITDFMRKRKLTYDSKSEPGNPVTSSAKLCHLSSS